MAEEKSSKRSVRLLSIFILSLFLFSLIPVGISADVTDTAVTIKDGDGFNIDATEMTLTAGSDLPPAMTGDHIFVIDVPVFYDKAWWMLYHDDKMVAFMSAKTEDVSFGVMKVYLPDFQIPAFAEPGQYHFVLIHEPVELEWWQKIIGFLWLWDMAPELLLGFWNFQVGESSLQDNLFAPYIIFIPANTWLIFETSKPFCATIPCPLFILLAIILFVVFIRLIVPLWLHIPKAWDPKYNRRKVKKL